MKAFLEQPLSILEHGQIDYYILSSYDLRSQSKIVKLIINREEFVFEESNNRYRSLACNGANENAY